MPVRLHLALLIVANIAALIGGFMLGMTLYESVQSALPGLLTKKPVPFIIFGMLPAALGYLLMRVVFTLVIKARCPKCGGPSIYHPSRLQKGRFGGETKRPISYHCKRCGYVHRTNVFAPNRDG